MLSLEWYLTNTRTHVVVLLSLDLSNNGLGYSATLLPKRPCGHNLSSQTTWLGQFWLFILSKCYNYLPTIEMCIFLILEFVFSLYFFQMLRFLIRILCFPLIPTILLFVILLILLVVNLQYFAFYCYSYCLSYC